MSFCPIPKRNSLFISIADPQKFSSIPDDVDGIELRLDLFPRIDLQFVASLIKSSPHSIILTLRKGQFKGSEQERESLIEQLLTYEPAFFDLEHDMRPSFLKRAFQREGKTRIILSYHNFDETPTDLESIYQSMARYRAHSYKIATMAHSTNDALRLLLFARKNPHVSGICMGEKGTFGRALGPIVGNVVDYASLDDAETTAPGQLTVQELLHTYRYLRLNSKTALYGLIGDPVGNSQGHLYHNGVFEKRGFDAVYVKMSVKPDELAEFFPLAQELGFRGLSVTMPLKDRVGGFNTLLLEGGQIHGTNTDGVGALDSIEKRGSVRGKKVVILGAGGAARAIAMEAKHRGAQILILNRTVRKAEELAAAVGCTSGDLEEVPDDYDILVKCTPDEMPIDPNKILSKAFVMDIVYVPKETPFLQAAKALDCSIIYGSEMFLNQAAAQTAFWFSPEPREDG